MNNQDNVTHRDVVPSVLDLVRTTLRFGEIATKATGRHWRLLPNKVEFFDPLGLADAGWDLWHGAMSNPSQVAAEQLLFWQRYSHLCSRESCRMLGSSVPPLFEPDSADNRFRDSAWESVAYFSFIKQRYLLFARSWRVRRCLCTSRARGKHHRRYHTTGAGC